MAKAQLANIKVGTRAEVIAARKAALERAQASVVLAQKTYDGPASWPELSSKLRIRPRCALSGNLIIAVHAEVMLL